MQMTEGVNSKRWSCRGCGWRQPVHCGSFFEWVSEWAVS